MAVLRTITVLEYELVPVVRDAFAAHSSGKSSDEKFWFTEDEAERLLEVNDIRPGFCHRSRNGIKLAQYCGIVQLGSCIVEVLPKTGLSDYRSQGETHIARGVLLSMLAAARKLRLVRPGSASQQVTRAPLLDLFIEAFLDAALEQARRGLLSRYVEHSDDLSVLKGRFNANGHLRRNHSRPQLLYCEFDELTLDNPYNQAVRSALAACRDWISQERTQRLWYDAHACFSNVAPRQMSGADVRRLPKERTVRRYDDLLRWCEWLLDMKSPSIKSGSSPAPGLLFDMNKLFESYVGRLYEDEFGESHKVVLQGPIKALSVSDTQEAFNLKPDITIWETSSDVDTRRIKRVVDAKWKRLNPHAKNWGVDQEDIYQLLAYALRYGCDRLELVYPQPNTKVGAMTLPVFPIVDSFANRTAITITVRTVPLWFSEAYAILNDDTTVVSG
jgi:5-methylcytosine-specific restriction enzyme subunit McrC